ncbi:MAG: SDR family NAD(P)-dependent oxidoreductase [Acetobacteraceae bacterium]|nr:SDR family NAD(P)-dependent oxidoreductase [Acetobacteraceae bacterium]
MNPRDEQLDRARQVIADLRRKLAASQSSSEPIAIIGMACRFPGEARDCAGYWRMIEAGRDAIRPIPSHRAPFMGGKLGAAALLDDIETFDAAFFDLSPREAKQMDPQQRLFLEVAWEALEDAGQTRQRLAGSAVSIFAGVHNHSSGYLELQNADAARLNEHSALGSGHDVIAGRLGYFLDTRGVTAAINTACSSSLFAVHTACQSLLAHDCTMAVAGGVNLILGPAQDRLTALTGMLAPDGRCKTFDARADGYGRGEGCGVVVLKRLSDAIAARDRVLAVIRGSAANQDGRSNGLTAPNGLAQEAVIRRALARAGVSAARVGYVETHGTGTALGDPIEIDALAAIYGAASADAPSCALGASKANINHLEGAAGIAGLIKAVLALRARVLPPVVGFERQNPHVSLAGTRLRIPTAASPWEAETPRVAAISAFGWSGANVHMLVEEAPEAPWTGEARPTVLLVSAADPDSLAARAEQFAAASERLPDAAGESFAWTATERRSQYEFRLAVAGEGGAGLAAALRRRIAEPPVSRRTGPRLGFLIGDDGSVAASCASALMRDEAAFRAAIVECAAAFEAAGYADQATSLRMPVGDGAIGSAPSWRFAFPIGVAALLMHWGLEPAAVAGWGEAAPAAQYLSSEISIAEAVRRFVRSGDGDFREAAEGRLARAGVDETVRLDTITVGANGGAPIVSARLALMRVVAYLAERGAEPVWKEIYDPATRLVSLPAHPFRRRRYWITEPQTEAVPASAPPDWSYESKWRHAARSAAADPVSHVLIIGDADGRGQRLAETCRRSGDGSAACVSDLSPELLAEHAGRGRLALIDVRALDRRTDAVASDALRLASQVADLDRLLGRARRGLDAKLWVVTRGAQCVRPGESPDLASAPLWGLGRSLGLDAPERWGGLVDLDPAAPFDAGQLRREIALWTGEEYEIALRGGDRYVRRIERMSAVPGVAMTLDPAATYLITGAFGGIGPSLARWLARRGATSLVLVGRSFGLEGDAASAELQEELAERGVEVRCERCDVGDADAVAALFGRIGRGGKPLRGIFHAAAVATDAVAEIGRSELALAFRPKVAGALALAEQSRGQPLDFLAFFSSAAAGLGARGRGHYAAANAFLDALAAARRAEGLPALSIQWGLWGGRDENAPDVQFFRRVGFDAMPPDLALDAMARLIAGNARGRSDFQPVLASLDGDRLRSAFALRGRSGLVAGLAAESSEAQSEESRAFVDAVRRAPAALRRTMLLDAIALQVRNVLEWGEEGAIDPERGFFDLGMDSLITLALRAKLEDLFAVKVPSTLTMDYPSVAALAGYFETTLDGAAAPVPSLSVPIAADRGEVTDGASRAVDEMSDDEVADALTAELEALAPELSA